MEPIDRLRELIERLEYIQKEISYVIITANKTNYSDGSHCTLHELVLQSTSEKHTAGAPERLTTVQTRSGYCPKKV